jgi:RimJ/RimL family protein N-acetyltransferase
MQRAQPGLLGLAGRLQDIVNSRNCISQRAIVEQTTGKVVGLVGYVPSFGPFGRMPFLHSRLNAASTMELGLFWAISPAAQRRGFATEAAGALVRHAFDRLSADRIVATTEHENVRSISVMRRLGMRVEHYPGSHPGLKVVGVLERGGD